MRLGAVLPAGLAGAPTAALVDYVQALERLGADHLTLFDHVLGADLDERDPSVRLAYDYRTPFREPLVLSSFLAAHTTTLEFATGVLALPQRQTALVAKQAADVALLSGDRLRLGVGVGLNPIEFEALGADFATRGARQEEQVAVLRALWAEDLVDFAGRWHRIDRAGLAPRPSRGIPVWLGGMAAVAIGRAVRIGDGFVAVVHGRADVARVQEIAGLARSAGRTDFGIEALIDQCDDAGAYRSLLAELGRAGATHVTVRTDAAGPDPSQLVDAVGAFLTAS